MNKYKIIFVDIDWTILDHNIHDWDYESLEALKSLQKQGILVYINTARPYDSIFHTHLLDIFTPDGIVSTNGGVIFIKDELFYQNIIPEEVVRQVEKISNKHHLVLELSTDKERYFTRKPNIYVDNYFSIFSEVKPGIKKYQNKGVTAILLFAPSKYDEILKKEYPKEVELIRYDTHGVDVSYFSNQKGDAVKRVLDHLGITKEEAISVGDSDGDISMFLETGTSIAMGNGTENAKKNATIVAPSISDHGLKQVLINDLKII